MTALAFASLSREHYEHKEHIEPAWLAHSLLFWVWVWPHSLEVTCIVIAMVAAVLEPRSSSHIAGTESPFGYKASKHIFMSQ